MDLQSHHPRVMTPTTVTLVDDDLYVRTHVSKLFTRYRDLRLIGVFEDGAEALAAAAVHPPDVMIVGIPTPAMSGPELIRLARAQRPGIQILAYTSSTDDQSLSDLVSAGAVSVISKEATVASVAAAIRATAVGLSVLSPRFSSGLSRPELGTTLTDSEKEVLRLLTCGLTNRQIAGHLRVSSSTVKYHLGRIADKLGTTSRVSLAVAAVRLGLDRDTTSGCESLPESRDWKRPDD